MVKRTFLLVLLAVFVLAIPVAHASLEDLVKDWRSIGGFKEGIHVTRSGIISAVQTHVRQGESEKRALIMADSDAVLQLARAIITETQADTSLQATVMLHFAKKNVSLKGHVLLSECNKGICRSVFAMTKDEWEKAKANVRYGRFSNALESFKKAPFANSSLLRELGLQELALLNTMRNASALYANVRLPIIPIESIMKKLIPLEEKRNEGVRSLPKSGAEHDITVQSIFAEESPKGFADKLEQMGIGLLEWHPQTPILRQVANVQGFVRFEGRAQNRIPSSMDFIKQCFAKGRELDLVIELLENAAERAPATPEVWEYLASAYLAADRPEPAQIAARAWFVTAQNPKEAGLWLLKKFKHDARSKEFIAFLENETVNADSI